MTDSLDELRRMSTGRRAAVPLSSTSGDEDEESCPAFGFLRGARETALHVSFRFTDGRIVSTPYSWLSVTRFHPSTGIVMLFAGGELFLVTLRGRNLNATLESGISLYERGLCRHRVVWVRESPPAEARTLPDGACVVEHIDIRTIKSEEAALAIGLAS
jgi:hypothetical protein